MAEKNSQGKHHIRIALFVPVMVLVVIGVAWYGFCMRSPALGEASAPQARSSTQVERLPDDLVAVGDAQYASLVGLAPGSREAQERQRQAVQQLGLPLEVKTRKAGIVFRLIPSGSVMMGSPAGESGRDNNETQHQVTLSKAFYCGKYEVTQGQWEAVMGFNRSFFKNAGKNAPVEMVSWGMCQGFVKRLCQIERVPVGTYRLLTEAEWEYACRAGTQGALYNGDLVIMGLNNGPALDPIGWYGGNSGVDYEGGHDSSDWPQKQYDHRYAGTHRVGTKRGNAFGLYDMIGNVCEWCQDWYKGYPSGPVVDPLGAPSGGNHTLRGGSWCSGASGCGSAVRYGFPPTIGHLYSGLRLARTVSSPSDTAELKNFGEVVDKLSHTKFDVSAANREPPDINPKAKELKDAGMDLFNKENRFQGGIEKIEAALKIDPRMPDAYGTLALYYAINKKDPRTAVRYLKEGIKNCPKSSLVRISFGNVYAQMNQPRRAIEQFTAAMKLGVEAKAPVLYNIGNAYIELNKKEDAISYYRKALSEDEKHLNARRNLVIALVQTGDRNSARQEAQRLLELDPDGESGNWARQALQKIGSL